MRKQNLKEKNMIKATKAKMCSDGDAKMQLFVRTLAQISHSTNAAPNDFFLVLELKCCSSSFFMDERGKILGVSGWLVLFNLDG